MVKNILLMIYFKRWLLSGLMMFMLFGVVHAQTAIVTGTVRSAIDNQPLPGVTVHVSSSDQGTVTDNQGEYRLSNLTSSDVLVFSFVGYSEMSETVGSRQEINVSLEAVASSLDQIIVIGYGTAKKRDLTGSISHIDESVLKNHSFTQLTEALAGTSSGMQVTQSGDAAGGGSMLIRGRKSLSANTDPLIVLDGAIYDGSMSDINPMDIESVDIMKDASAAAVYGASAAGGVVLVTTKKGQIGAPEFSFSSKITLSTTTHDLRPFGPKSYLAMYRDYRTQNDIQGGGVHPVGYYYSPAELPNDMDIQEWRDMSNNPAANDMDEWANRLGLEDIEKENLRNNNPTDFYNQVIKKSISQDFTIGIRGGTEELKYYLSGEYINNKGVVVGDMFKAARLRLNLDFNVTRFLDLGARTQFSSRDQSVVQASVGQMINVTPWGSMFDDNGDLRSFPDGYSLNHNPLENNFGQDRLNRINSLFSELYTVVKLPEDIQFRLSYQPRLSFTKDYNYWNSNTTTGGDSHVGGFGRRIDQQLFGWRLDNVLTWRKDISVNHIEATVLYSAEVDRSWNSTQESGNFSPNENLGFNSLQFGAEPNITNNDVHSSGNSFMGRLNYNLLDRYLFTASFRRDGFSAFGSDNQFANFPAAALAWRISNEPFFNVNWIDDLKLRGSWGINGNRNIGVYSALSQMGTVLTYDGSVHSGVFATSLSNPNLRWEKTQSINLGIDLGLIDEKISLSIDAYRSKTNDLLMNRSLPILTGFTEVTTNLGELDNKGLNLSIEALPISSNNFSWRSNVIFSINRNKIKHLFGDYGDYRILNQDHHDEELPDFTNGWFIDQASDVIWDYDVIGVWQQNEESHAKEYGLAPGEYRAVDVNNDGVYLQFDDKRFIGHTTPQYNIGFRNEIEFLKKFSFSIFLRADLDYKRPLSTLTSNKSSLGRQNFYSWPYWSLDNPDNVWGRLAYPDDYNQYEGGITIYKSSGFLRLQDVAFSYQFPQVLLDKIKVKSATVYFSGRNLLMITDYPGFDPESGLNPMMRDFSLGINFTF